jgi:hypothetical protein
MANNTPKNSLFSSKNTNTTHFTKTDQSTLVTAKQYRAHAKCSLIAEKLLPAIEKIHNDGEKYFKEKSNLNLWCNQARIR